MKERISVFILLLCLLHFPSISFAKWQHLRPGLEYQGLREEPHIHVFRIDPKLLQLKLILAKDLGLSQAYVKDFAKYSPALVTINGGFFDHEYRPLGLRINQHQQKNPLKPISWWGIFYIKNSQGYVSNLREFRYDESMSLALQSGPLLLVNGKIPRLKPGLALRSAIGIREDGRIIILISNNSALSTTTLARLMQAAPLNCRNALNLDGGSSSQLYANIGSFRLDLPGFSKISDAIAVSEKPANYSKS